MTSTDLIPTALLERKAVVYVRQSTQSQVMTNLESQRRQYDLVDVARQRGFLDVEVIDDDLGRSASGTVARPGFDRLVALLCAGKVGAVLCFDASRLARNGRDWHHLLELCGLVEARVIDHDGVYNPCRPNDRLLLGMKGSISEFELGVLRARMLDAARSKARRGAASLNRMGMPIGQGKTWTAHRVASVRRVRAIHAYKSADKDGEWLTMTEAAATLGVTNHRIRHLIEMKVLSAEQVVRGAPHQIRVSDLASATVQAAIARKGRSHC
jgi:DNA invertase Pin-like site-specific DNA recombinase